MEKLLAPDILDIRTFTKLRVRKIGISLKSRRKWSKNKKLSASIRKDRKSIQKAKNSNVLLFRQEERRGELLSVKSIV